MIRLLRPKQWSKSLLVLAAPLFVGFKGHPDFILPTIEAFLAISLISSATYVANDLLDIEKDRAHPTKRNRPLASGAISKQAGIAAGAVCLIAGLALAWMLGKGSLIIVAVYLGLQVLYNGPLKAIPVADVYTISLGFVLRAALGAAAIHVSISGWLLFCTGSLALMLGFAKRRQEFVVYGDKREMTRPSLKTYTKGALDALVMMSAAGAAICYAIYSIESKTAHKYPGIILTSIFVFYGISRYTFVVFTEDEGGEPAELLFRDRHLQFSIVAFVAAAIVALSGVNLPILEK